MSVENSDCWLTADQVRQALDDQGLVIPQTRLDRQRTEGLLPPARRQGRGRGQGRGPAEYPAETPAQAACLHRLLSSDRNIKRAGWKLWLDGFQVAPEFWIDELSLAAKIWDEAAPHIAAKLDDDGVGFADLAAVVFQFSGGEVALKRARKALRQNGFEEFLLIILSIAVGVFTDISTSQEATHPDRQSASRILDLGLGLADARNLQMADGTRFLHGDFTPVLAELAATLGEGSMREQLAATPESELLAARNEIAFLLILAEVLWRSFGGPERAKAPPLKSAGSLLGMGPPVQATMILVWLRYRNSPGVREIVSQLVVAVQTALQSDNSSQHVRK